MRIIILAGLLALWFGIARAEEVSAADGAAIRDVITRQIDAFRHDDAAAAFGYAAPSIQRQMGTAERFLELVREHYQPVAHPRSTRFGRLSVQDGQVVQQVELIGPDGVPAGALYSLEREPDGTWRIGGCVLTESQSVGA